MLYVPFRSCWLNYGDTVSYGSIVPIGTFAAIAVIAVEASGMGEYTKLPLTMNSKRYAAA